jgi:photosystem II stability/assembly factor-like uncharacterized protein
MIPGTVWQPKGPSPIQDGGLRSNGMVTSIAVHPSNSQIVFIGTADGGVWKTGDGGATWQALFDEQLCLAIGEPNCIAIDPGDSDILYVGTSARGRVAIQRQVGIFKSLDGGASWILLGSGYPEGNDGNADRFANDLVNTIIVDPSNSARVYAASSSGVWVSTDAGQNWVRGTNSAGDARSLVFDSTSPNNARILYAGLSGQGVIQSTDGGATWAPIMTAATPSVAAALGAVPGTALGQVVLDLAPPAAPPAAGGIQVIYAAIAPAIGAPAGAPDPVGLFLSTDQGATWAQQAANGGPSTTFNGYCMAVAVDPASPGDGANDIVYWGTQSQARSADSGANFTNVSAQLHADTHAWAFFRPPVPASTTVYCGNDGGIFRSTDDGANWTPLNEGGLQTTLLYNIDVKPDATASVSLGALQDNRLEKSGAGLVWNTIGGGDGWDIVYDGVTADRIIATTNSGGAIQTIVLRSTDDGASFSNVTPWPAGGTEAGFYAASLAADPTNDGIFYAASNQNLWQSLDGGNNWRSLFAVPAANFITANIAVAPTNGNNVVVANGSQVFVSTNALAPTVGAPTGVTFAAITRNLPGRNVLRTAFDPNDETVIYAVLGGFAGAGAPGHVFRTTIGGTAWTDISPAVDVPFGAIALDGSETPSTIYAGCDLGVLRSVDRGATWYVLDDIHFPNAPVTDLVIGRGSGILRASTYGRGVFEFALPTGPVIAVNLENDFEFGTVCEEPTHLTLQVFNVGTANLVIHSVQRLMGSTAFVVDPFPATPLVIAPGGEVDFTVHYTPTAPGASDTATIRIRSNDPGAPTLDLMATGTGGVATAEVAIADAGDFGEVCLGSFGDRDLVINNSGTCRLEITAITSSSPAFVVPGVISFPLVVSAGGSITVSLRFQPTALGSAAATIQVFSNDPASPLQVQVRGTAPPPRLVLSIADHGDFCHTCVGDCNDKPLILSNSGRCKLTVTGISSSSGEFLVPDVTIFPLVISAGSAVSLMLRFQPTSFGTKSATITVTSDDPASPATVAVSGTVPSGKLAITGTTHFGAVELGVRALQTVSICNVGECDLHVSKVAFKPLGPCEKYRHRCCDCGPDCGCGGCGPGCGCGHKREGDYRHDHDKKHDCDQKCLNFKIVTNPFPATVHPGSCLGVLIQYVPTCDNAACCELVIQSDDPDDSLHTLFVTGHLRRTLRSALKCWAAQELQEILKAGKGC